MDFVQGLDPSKLVLAETALSFLLSPFAAPPYNLPIFLFGAYAQENAEAAQSLQTFTGMLGVSAIFDIIWMARHEQNGFIKFLTVILLLLKIPTFAAFALAMRQRGSGLNLRGSDITGPTVWSMPGGFTSSAREGYQTVDDDQPPPPPARSAPQQPPAPVQPLGANPPQAPGGYQNV
ncbi:hypothetical protein EV122DRAFT_276722 [Schizophyllum commune]|nr:hypothetical protein K525DRAFT_258241 [Schizophyllum commune Loenen D]